MRHATSSARRHIVGRPTVALCILLTLVSLWPAASAFGQEARPYQILVTNDDGVRAPGLLALARALQPLGTITIVAPAENQSGKGHSLTLGDPLYVDVVKLEGDLTALAVGATPASCVKLALTTLLAAQPDLVVSGINRGYNQGMVAYVSGTVGAAREAALRGIPAIAASLASAGHPSYDAGAAMTARVAEQVKRIGLERGVFLNVNIPPGPIEALKGLKLTGQSASFGTERFEERRTPSGRRYFWNLYQDPTDETEGSDVRANALGYVAVTPLRVGELDRRALESLKEAIK